MNLINLIFHRNNIKYVIALILVILGFIGLYTAEGTPLITILFFAILGVLLLFNIPSKWVEDSFAFISYKYKISSAIAGGLFLAIASSSPEFFTAVSGVIWYKIFDIAFDTLVWSSIFNLCVIIGVVTFYKPQVQIRKNILKRDMPALGITILVLLLLALDGSYSAIDFGILVMFYFSYVLILYLDKSKPYSEVINDSSNLKIILKLLIGFILIAFLAHTMISFGQQTIGLIEEYYDVILPIGVLACTIYGPGTSIADLFMSIAAIKKGEDTAAVVNGISSNTFDLTICIGVPGLIYTFLSGNAITIDLNASILLISILLVSFILVFFILRNGKITRKEGFILLLFYGICTIIYLLNILIF
ncbi:sodium:calcium antiporter [Lutibacter sp.]|uniref:sodium:calcium antiporter n=1 Tax=Lutibacter sp. TaxID=1925666 RepID=UPI0034A09A1F